MYQVKSPILFIIFNRLDTTQKVFDAIKSVKPSKLYVSADGPRKGRNDEQLCSETQNIIKQIDWECEVKTLFREENLGCKHAVSSGISWFFENEPEGIILEDDCLPNADFFFFCDIMLEKYRLDTRIRHIGGSNFQNGIKRNNGSYYFSNLTHVWGWASWRRVWNEYDVELAQFDEKEALLGFNSIFDQPLLADSWLQIFKDLKDNKIDTWDYQLTISNFLNNSLSIIPSVNLIENIGFNEQATHTFNAQSTYANVPTQELDKNLIHPKTIVPSKVADNLTLYHDFDINRRLKRFKRKNTWFYKLKKKVTSFFRKNK